MFFKNRLEKKLKQWGKDVRVLPPSALSMKSKVLDLVQIPNKTVSRSHRPLPYFIALSGMAAVLLLFVGVQLYTKNSLLQPASFGVTYDAAPQAMSGSGDGDLSTFVESDELGVAYGQATGFGSSDSGSVLANASDVAGEASKDFSSLIAPTAVVSDTREFLQYKYNASIKSRRVEELADGLQTVVRGYGGRIESVSVQKKYGYIYFIVSKSSFEEFENEVKSLANARFYNSQKFYSEDQTKKTQAQIASLVGQDKELQDVAETVQGSIQLQWMGVFEMIHIYVPYFWLWIIIVAVLGICIRHYTKRRSFEVT